VELGFDEVSRLLDSVVISRFGNLDALLVAGGVESGADAQPAAENGTACTGGHSGSKV
jgi:hypothetical protein